MAPSKLMSFKIADSAREKPAEWLDACPQRVQNAHNPHGSRLKLLSECNTPEQHFLKWLERLKSRQMPVFLAFRYRS